MLNNHQKKKERKTMVNYQTGAHGKTGEKKPFKIKDTTHYQNKRPTIKQMLKSLTCIIKFNLKKFTVSPN